MRPAFHRVTPHRSSFASLLACSSLVTIAMALALAGCGQKDPLRPGPTTGSIIVKANIAGASIRIDGEATGLVTPDTVGLVEPGPHTISVTRAGFVVDPAETLVTVVAGGTSTVRFFMNATVGLGSIAVETNLPGGEILLDGERTGLTAPDTLEFVPEGDHEVGIHHVGTTAAPVLVSVGMDTVVIASFDETIQHAASHTVLLEHFTNWQCVPCTQSDPELDSLYKELGRDEVVYIAYHENIASANDPFYLFNPTENRGRLNYYFVTGSPWVGLDGQVFSLAPYGWESPQAYDILRQAVLDRITAGPPLTVTVEAEEAGGQYRIRVGVGSGVTPPAGSLVLHTVIVEKEPVAAPGIHGQTLYPWAMRDMVPDKNGTAFTIGADALASFSFEVPFDPAWDPDEVGVVAFVQRVDAPGQKQVIQSGSTF